MSDNYEPGKLYEISLLDLQPDENQPRKYIDPESIEDLSNSISQHGVLQPIIFRKNENELLIVAGERRYHAAKKAGLETIPAIFIESNNSKIIALTENIAREDMLPLELAEALKGIIEEEHIEQQDLAKYIGKKPSTVSEILRVNDLPEEIKEKIRQDKRWTRQALLDIARTKDSKVQKKLFTKALNQLNRSEATEIPNQKNAKIKKSAIDQQIKFLETFLIEIETSDFTQDQLSKIKSLIVDINEKLGSLARE